MTFRTFCRSPADPLIYGTFVNSSPTSLTPSRIVIPLLVRSRPEVLLPDAEVVDGAPFVEVPDLEDILKRVLTDIDGSQEQLLLEGSCLGT